jgi:transcriptional regulator of arginine metabolism
MGSRIAEPGAPRVGEYFSLTRYKYPHDYSFSMTRSASDKHDKLERQKALQALIQREDIPDQDALAKRLHTSGWAVAQASISRDLREIGAAKIGGVYRVPPAGPSVLPSSPLDLVSQLIRDAQGAGPHLVVVKTAVGGASPVGLAVDAASWPEVVGTLAGDDTLFVATAGSRGRDRLLRRIAGLLEARPRATREVHPGGTRKAHIAGLDAPAPSRRARSRR